MSVFYIPHGQADKESDGAACGIGSQVEPFARAVGGAVFLNEFNASAHADGSQPGP